MDCLDELKNLGKSGVDNLLQEMVGEGYKRVVIVYETDDHHTYTCWHDDVAGEGADRLALLGMLQVGIRDLQNEPSKKEKDEEEGEE